MRARKHHEQQELFRHGGKRRRAGRPRRGPRASEKHKTRPRFRAYEPVHVTLRIADHVGSLRRRAMYRALRWATLSVARKQQDTFRIVHMSIQRDHVHLICEAADHVALARGIQGFAGSAAKHINAVRGGTGSVFPDRYHTRVLKSPTSAHHAISYVLNNWRHHRHDESAIAQLVDPFSSGISFPGWKELEGATVMWKPRASWEPPLFVWLPQTWFLREGWRHAGPISALDVPAS